MTGEAAPSTSSAPTLQQPGTVAAFDFDGTLTRADTLLPFMIFSLGWLGFLRAMVLSLPWLLGYALRMMSNHRAKARLLQVGFSGQSYDRIALKAGLYVAEALPGQWQAWTLGKLLEHQRLGHRCLIVSASPSLYMHAVGRSLGLDTVLCTEMEHLNGVYTGKMATPNCHGQEKVQRLQAWLDKTYGPQNPPALHAYGDTSGDKPMLRMADLAWYRGKPWAEKRNCG